MLRTLSNPRVLAGLLLVAALAAVALWPRAIAVDVQPLVRGKLQVTIDGEGRTRVRERFTVSAPVAGRVLRIELEPGDDVARDETVLATFRPEDPALLDTRTRAQAEAAAAAARAVVGRAEAERARALAALDLARSEAQRHRGLADAGVVSREVVEAKETAARTAQESLHAAEYAVATARHDLEGAQARLLSTPVAVAGGTEPGGGAGRTIALRSPIDGVVLQRFHESEAIVPAGAPLIEVADPSMLEIVADLLSTDAVRIRQGQPVLVDRWGGAGVLQGRVRRVEPFAFTKISALGVEEQRVNVVIQLEDPVEAYRALGDGYRVEVRVVVWSAEDVLKVPATALFRRGERWAAFVADGARARLVPVEIGERNETEAQVLSGLDPGQPVIVHPGDRVEDGARIAPRSAP